MFPQHYREYIYFSENILKKMINPERVKECIFKVATITNNEVNLK